MATVRFRWIEDELYETRGSYGYDTEEETKAAEDEEIAKLRSGEWVAEGCIAELVSVCDCCDQEKIEAEASLWGIVGATPEYRHEIEQDLRSELVTDDERFTSVPA